MPKISIVIPAYNVGDYLQECLDSVRNQTFSDIEAIVVNDASPDNVGEIAVQAAEQDPRIRVVTNNPNMGTHRTRMAGVENASGEYTFFLDGDDALKPDMCEQLAAEIDKHPVDVLHYGLTVVAANELLENERQAFETFNNTPTPDSTGEDIVRDIFDETRGYKVDWRVTQRLYKTSMLKEAFNAMTRDRLGRSQDGYECFVVSAFANSYHSFKECRGYVYYYGRGISGTNMIDAAKYARYCGHFKADFDAAYEFANTQDSDMLRECAQGFQRKATEILANDWKVRVPEEEKAEVELWRDYLKPYAFVKAVMPMDAFARCWVQEYELWKEIELCLTDADKPTFASLHATWIRQKQALYSSSLEAMAAYMVKVSNDKEVLASQSLIERLRSIGRSLGFIKKDLHGAMEDAQVALSTRAADWLCTLTQRLININGLEGSGTFAPYAQ